MKRRLVPTDVPIAKTSISSVPKSSKLKSAAADLTLRRRLLWQTGLCRYYLQCPSLLCGAGRHRFIHQRDGVRALLGGHRVDALAQPAQLLHAQDCLLHLLRLDVLQFVDVEALFLVSLREENDGDSKVLATGRIQTETCLTTATNLRDCFTPRMRAAKRPQRDDMQIDADIEAAHLQI